MTTCKKCGCSYDAWDGSCDCEKEEKEKTSAGTEADAIEASKQSTDKLTQIEAPFKCFTDILDEYFFGGNKNA